MTVDLQHLRVLITVMTYPHPKQSHDEVVCTAGVTEDGEWIRLFPVDYRYLPEQQQFRKYQWIELDVRPQGYKTDVRKESREPRLDSIQLIGEPIPSANKWQARRVIIDQLPHHTVNQLIQLHEEEHISLGVVRPKRVLDLEISPTDREWEPKYQQIFQQLRLFREPLPLRKIPFEFRYVFECEDDEKPRRALITDWELGALYLREEVRLGSEQAAAESVKTKFLGEICREDKDTRFFMGTVFPFNHWIVVGTFWPPRITERQIELF